MRKVFDSVYSTFLEIQLPYALSHSHIQWIVNQSLSLMKDLNYHDCIQLMTKILHKTKGFQSNRILEAAAQVFCNVEKGSLKVFYNELDSFKSEVIWLCHVCQILCSRGWKCSWVRVNQLRIGYAQIMHPLKEQPLLYCQQLAIMPQKLQNTDTNIATNIATATTCSFESGLVSETLRIIDNFMCVLVAQDYLNIEIWDAITELFLFLQQSHIVPIQYKFKPFVMAHIDKVAETVGKNEKFQHHVYRFYHCSIVQT